MVYNKQFVAVVKCNGNILREKNDVVTLPFGSEYSILLKNLSSRRANVNISIDGNDMLYGQSLILEPEKETELLGSIHGAAVNNRFKFIQKTKQIQEHRGDKLDDGMIRIEFAFEKPQAKIIDHNHHHYDYTYHPPVIGKRVRRLWQESSDPYKDTMFSSSTIKARSCFHATVGQSVVQNDVTLNTLDVDEGITVAGSKVSQDFSYTSIGELDEAEVIILRLRGIKSDGATIKTPITVKTKLKCPTCGIISKSDASFCSNCGTSLQ